MLAVVTNLICVALMYEWIGLAGIGFGTVPGALLESVVLARIVRQLTAANLFASMPSFSLASLLATVAGFAVTSVIAADGLGAVAGAATAAAIAAALSMLMERSVCLDLLSLGRRSVSAALGAEHAT